MTARAAQGPPEEPHAAADRSACPVAGIGASAGGLESFTRLLRALPARPGVALVLVQHLDPTHESALAEILQRSTKIPVIEAENGMLIETNHVYVMPPNVTMELSGGAIKLQPRSSSPSESLPIDGFMRSLAAECEGRAIGVVLSGTGSDGAQGLSAIKEAGGLTFVQDPLSADYAGMPSAAIDAGAADSVLDPEQLAERLVQVAHRLCDDKSGVPVSPEAVDEGGLDTILRLVRSASGLDLTHYRRTTLVRRISRRMLLGGFDTMEEYARALKANPTEVDALYRDVLVNVTQFFRDPSAIEALTREAYPAILERKVPDSAFRLWVPGCSKGQEAYSILISLVEFLEDASIRPEIQMFASDVNELDIKYARTGTYPDSISREMSPERLARFFSQVPGGFRVDQAIRDMCVFAVHDITRDPPFSRLDVVSFRNVLIYMERPLQKHVLEVIHYALEPGGFLLLGSAESTGGQSALFSVVDKKHRLYKRKPGPARLLPSLGPPTSSSVAEQQLQRGESGPEFDVLREAEKVALDTYAPSGLLVNEALEIVQFRGDVGQFLSPAEGPADLALSKIVVSGVAASARAAIREASKTGHRAKRTGFLSSGNGDRREVSVEAVPVSSPTGESYYLIVLEATPKVVSQPAPSHAEQGEPPEPGDQVAKLREELEEAREYVETMVAEKDAVNLDLRIVGDRLQTTNEELRTINEEYQTAQEELQSTNEELTTLNDELRNRNAELGQLSDDLENVIQGVEIPILILGPDLLIHRFTPQAQRIINILPTDIGRVVTDLTLKVDVPDLKTPIAQVLRTLSPVQADVRGTDGLWYSMRIRPYLTGQGAVEGVVVAFIDVDLAKRAMAAAEAALEHSVAIVETVREPLLTLGADMEVLEANPAFYETFGVSAEETIGTGLFALGDGQWDIPELRSLIGEVLPGDTDFAGLEVEHVFPRIGRRIVLLGARRIREEQGPPRILLAIDDVTNTRRQARMIDALNEIGLKISSTFELDEVLDEVLRLSATVVCADSGTILLKRPDGWLVKSTFGMSHPAVGDRLADEQVPLSGLCATSRDPILVPDISRDERFPGSIGSHLGHHCVLMVPLLLRQETIGSISFHHLVESGNFDDVDLDFARRLGTLLSLAFENSQLYSAQRQIAETLQTALLTPPRAIPGIRFGYLYRSATTAASVGGDLYDLFELSDNCVGVLIGDVSGKGVEAATLAGLVKNTIRALSYENPSPASVITKANDVIFKATSDSVFVTLMFGMINTRSGRLVYCSAGHTRGMIRRRQGAVEVLKVQSPLAGAFGGVEFLDGVTSLAEGDSLVLYTDGVTEARHDGELLGEERLAEIVRSIGTISAARMPDAIFERVLDFAEGNLADDVAIVSVGLGRDERVTEDSQDE